MARLLLHTLVFSPDGVSTSYLMADLARELKRCGHDVRVLTTTPHYNVLPEATARQPLHSVWPGLLYRSQCDGIQVFHVRMPLKGSKVFGRLVDYLRFHAVAMAASFRTVGRYDVVLAVSPPLTMGLLGWLQGLLRGAPSIYNVQEVYPDFLVSQGLVTHQFLIRLLQWLERIVYKRNTKIVAISEWFSRTIRARGVPPEKIVVIPNFVDTRLYRPLPRANAFAVDNGLMDCFTVLYGGNVGLSQDWESILFAARALEENPIQFVIVGDGARREWLRTEVKRRNLRNVKLIGYQPREKMPEINASSDIGTIPQKTGSTSDTFPSKIYTIMACGKAVLVSADSDSELAWLVKTAACGRVVEPDAPDAYADAVLRAFEEREVLPLEGARGRQCVQERYSSEAVARKYDKLIRELTS